MLATVIMMFLVMSLTGVATLDLSYASYRSSLNTKSNIQTQFLMESAVNKALWMINTGEDSLVTGYVDGIYMTYNKTSHILSASLNTPENCYEVSLNLVDDTHFDQAISSHTQFTDNGYTCNNASGNPMHNFGFLPEVDIKYWKDRATAVLNANENSWVEDALVESGTYILTGNTLTLDSLNCDSSTLVFTGKKISITNSRVLSEMPGDSLNAPPALVFTNPNVIVHLDASNEIAGAIYCAGNLNLYNAALTGPVIAETIQIHEDIFIHDKSAKAYYSWQRGFGSRDTYDWPKHVNRWKINHWTKTS